MASGGFSISLLNEQELSSRYVLGILNSRLLFRFLNATSNVFRGGWITCTKQYIGTLPIRTIDLSDKTDKARHDEMVKLVERMLELHRQKATARTGADQTQIERRITATDRQIDRLVYELYELTDEEIALVENENS